MVSFIENDHQRKTLRFVVVCSLDESMPKRHGNMNHDLNQDQLASVKGQQPVCGGRGFRRVQVDGYNHPPERRTYVAQWLHIQNSNPRNLGSIPSRGMDGEGEFFLSLRVNSLCRLVCAC